MRCGAVRISVSPSSLNGSNAPGAPEHSERLRPGNDGPDRFTFRVPLSRSAQRNPIENQGTRMIAAKPMSRAVMYPMIGRIPASGWIRLMAQAA